MRVAVLGLGLIGGSAALALAEAGHEVVGYDTAAATREAAAGRFAVAADPDGLLDADVAVLAVPIVAMGRIAPRFAPDRFGGVLTDVASVKSQAARQLGAHPRFVGGHPMAGKTTAGFAAAEAGLFHGRKWVLCLEPGTDLAAWTLLADLWTSVGAHVVPTSAAAHDRAAARISHVEHATAAALARIAADPLSRALAAGSFRDGTRVAASPTELFEGMVEGNGPELLEALADLGAELDRIRDGIESYRDHPGAVRDWFDEARRLRATWPPEPGDAETMRLGRSALLELGAAGGWVESVRDNEVAVVRRPRVKSTP